MNIQTQNWQNKLVGKVHAARDDNQHVAACGYSNSERTCFVEVDSEVTCATCARLAFKLAKPIEAFLRDQGYSRHAIPFNVLLECDVLIAEALESGERSKGAYIQGVLDLMLSLAI